MVAVRAAVPSLRKGSSSAATIAQSRTSPPHLVCEENLRDPCETLLFLPLFRWIPVLLRFASRFRATLGPLRHPTPGPGRGARAQGVIVAIPRGTIRIATIIIPERKKNSLLRGHNWRSLDPKTATIPGLPHKAARFDQRRGGCGGVSRGKCTFHAVKRTPPPPPPPPRLASMAAVRRKDELTRVKTHTKPKRSIPADAPVASPGGNGARAARKENNKPSLRFADGRATFLSQPEKPLGAQHR